VLGDAGYWLMTVTALFATAGATNAGLYPAMGLTDHLVSTGQFPAFMATRVGPVHSGLLIVAVAVIALVSLFGLTAIASIGSAVALMIFALVTIGHLRIRSQTGAHLGMLVIALATTLIALLTFVVTTLIQEPASVATLIAIAVISVVFDRLWSRPHVDQPAATT